jgi:hypothetical protein
MTEDQFRAGTDQALPTVHRFDAESVLAQAAAIASEQRAVRSANVIASAIATDPIRRELLRLSQHGADHFFIGERIGAELSYLKPFYRARLKDSVVDEIDAGILRTHWARINLRVHAIEYRAMAERLGAVKKDPPDDGCESWTEYLELVINDLLWLRDFIGVEPGPLYMRPTPEPG